MYNVQKKHHVPYVQQSFFDIFSLPPPGPTLISFNNYENFQPNSRHFSPKTSRRKNFTYTLKAFHHRLVHFPSIFLIIGTRREEMNFLLRKVGHRWNGFRILTPKIHPSPSVLLKGIRKLRRHTIQVIALENCSCTIVLMLTYELHSGNS